MENEYAKPLFHARMTLGLTTEEAGQYVHVTRKTWEKWEKLEASGKEPPQAKVELFFSKIANLDNKDCGSLVVIVDKNLTPIDVVAESNYLGFTNNGDGTGVIKSMSIDWFTKRLGVTRTHFPLSENTHVVKFCESHAPIYED
ncbi:hypothetical protein ISO55_04385 [Morganella morganii subsp. morganii]|uniref:hypothetical protein n=1 Tax=Morganella morganii TaxID=582 RepID=UPI001BD9A266|nr:hypothetical protein [Morganella morganii]MBT0366214.1 hypothetical protein [Morganella morganii subsp. morganii]